jgi:hypothetical protein
MQWAFLIGLSSKSFDKFGDFPNTEIFTPNIQPSPNIWPPVLGSKRMTMDKPYWDKVRCDKREREGCKIVEPCRRIV